MRTLSLIVLSLISSICYGQIKERASFSLGVVDFAGLSSKVSYGFSIKDLVNINLNLGYFNINSGDYYLTTLFDKDIYSYSVNSNVKSGFYSSKNLFNTGISTSLNILKFIPSNKHKLNIETGFYFKRYEISNIHFIKDNSNIPFIRSINQKKITEYGLNYALQYEYLIKEKTSIGASFDIIPFDGGNSNTLSILLVRYF